MLPEIFYEDVESARTLLLLHLQRPEFAQRFLSVCPTGYRGSKHDNSRSSRVAPRRISPQRRQSSSVSPEVDQTSPTAIAAEQLYSTSDHRTVFDLMHHLVQDSRGDRKQDQRDFVMLTGHKSNKAKHKDTRDDAAANDDDTLSRVDLFRNQLRPLHSLDSALAEDLHALCRRQAAFDHPSVWKLLQFLNAAWHTQRKAGQQSHLAAQLPPSKRSNEEVGTVLDLIFAGLSIHDRYDANVVRRPNEANEGLRHTAALDLMNHCLHLVDDGVIHSGAMTRGIVDRLNLVPLETINTIRQHAQRSNQQQRDRNTNSVLPEAVVSYLKHDTHHTESGSDDENDDDVDYAVIKGTRISRTDLSLSQGFLLQEIIFAQQSAPLSNNAKLDAATSTKLQQATTEATTMYTLARRLSLLLLLRRLSVSRSDSDDTHYTETYNEQIAELSRQLDHISSSQKRRKSSRPSRASDLLGDSLSDDDDEQEEQSRQDARRKRLKTSSHTNNKDSEQTQVAELLQWLQLRTKELKSGVQEYLKASQ